MGWLETADAECIPWRVCNCDRGNAGGYFVVAASRLGLQLHVLRVCVI